MSTQQQAVLAALALGSLFIGTKIIKAVPMDRADYIAYRGWPLPENENGADLGYLVEYTDGGKPNVDGHEGYVSWSPKEQFDKAYRPMADMAFGAAIEAIKAGHKVARKGWNGKGMFVYFVPANSYPAQTGAAQSHFGEGGMVPYNAYMALKGADNTVSTWAPSGSDALAEDWMIVGTIPASAWLPHQQRVIDEKTELDERHSKLTDFLDSKTFLGLSDDERYRLRKQAMAMAEYSMFLGLRIAAFGSPVSSRPDPAKGAPRPVGHHPVG